jgi:hypothetical protein
LEDVETVGKIPDYLIDLVCMEGMAQEASILVNLMDW